MPGRLFLNSTSVEIAEEIGVSASFPDGFQGGDIAPGDAILTLAPDPKMMRWGILPVGRVNARGRPVMETLINVRSETLFEKSAFEGFRFCVVPANGWFEWTGKARRKTRWRLSAKDGRILAFAAVCDCWQGPTGHEVWQVATVTCEPNKEVAEVHHRMGVLLQTDQIETWINGSQTDRQALCMPSPDGSIRVETD